MCPWMETNSKWINELINERPTDREFVGGNTWDRLSCWPLCIQRWCNRTCWTCLWEQAPAGTAHGSSPLHSGFLLHSHTHTHTHNTTIHYTFGRSAFVPAGQRKTMTTWPLPRTIPSDAKDAFDGWGALWLFVFMAPYINVLNYLVTDQSIEWSNDCRYHTNHLHSITSSDRAHPLTVLATSEHMSNAITHSWTHVEIESQTVIMRWVKLQSGVHLTIQYLLRSRHATVSRSDLRSNTVTCWHNRSRGFSAKCFLSTQNVSSL